MNKAEYVFEKIAKSADKTFKDMLTGALAGTLATSATMPLENIQINQASQGSKYYGQKFMDVAKGLVKEKKLWVGTGSKLLKVAPTMGITFGAYELLKTQLK